MVMQYSNSFIQLLVLKLHKWISNSNHQELWLPFTWKRSVQFISNFWVKIVSLLFSSKSYLQVPTVQRNTFQQQIPTEQINQTKKSKCFSWQLTIFLAQFSKIGHVPGSTSLHEPSIYNCVIKWINWLTDQTLKNDSLMNHHFKWLCENLSYWLKNYYYYYSEYHLFGGPWFRFINKLLIISFH